METRRLFYALYMIIVITMLIPTIMSVLPHEARRANRLGYESRCSFVPWSRVSMVAILLRLLGIVYAVEMFTAS